MRAYNRRLIIKYLLSIPVVSLFACNNTVKVSEDNGKRLLITSDVHFSLSEGRWPETSTVYKETFSSLLGGESTILFVNGDFIDAVEFRNGKNVRVDKEYWDKEVEAFLEVSSSFKNTEILLNYGRGHDFKDFNGLSLEYAEETLSVYRRGVHQWEGISLIWFTIYPASFSTTSDAHQPAMNEVDYQWLTETLESNKKSLLFFHVPIRTNETYEAGKWHNDRNLTIPYSDKLYRIIDKYSNKIVAIFNGHIHQTVISHYKTIPVFIFPFIEKQSYCEVKMYKNKLKVIPSNESILPMDISIK